ncbi:MAG: hypothetical protein MUC88_15045 [Planctomycetes bacterium]|nr:hypothetical protein [Planctomycetota bacterium]
MSGLVTAVPLAGYHLLFHAPREQYAWLVAFLIGWPFLYWPTVGPLLMLLKLRTIYRGLRQVRSLDDLCRRLADGETEDVIIAWIARENRIPQCLARRAYRYLLRLIAASRHGEPSLVPEPSAVSPLSSEQGPSPAS